LDCGGKAERGAALEKDKPGWFASESAVAAALRSAGCRRSPKTSVCVPSRSGDKIDFANTF